MYRICVHLKWLYYRVHEDVFTGRSQHRPKELDIAKMAVSKTMLIVCLDEYTFLTMCIALYVQFGFHMAGCVQSVCSVAAANDLRDISIYVFALWRLQWQHLLDGMPCWCCFCCALPMLTFTKLIPLQLGLVLLCSKSAVGFYSSLRILFIKYIMHIYYNMWMHFYIHTYWHKCCF